MLSGARGETCVCNSKFRSVPQCLRSWRFSRWRDFVGHTTAATLQTEHAGINSVQTELHIIAIQHRLRNQAVLLKRDIASLTPELETGDTRKAVSIMPSPNFELLLSCLNDKGQYSCPDTSFALCTCAVRVRANV